MQLSGPDDQAAKVLEASHQYRNAAGGQGIQVAGGESDPRHAWELTLDGNIQLFVGRSDIALRLQRFIDAFPVIEPRERVATWIFDTTPGWQLAGRKAKRK